MKKLIILLAVALFGVASYAKNNKEEVFIYLDTSDTLYITVIDNMNDGWDIADRFYYFETILTELLEEIDFPMEYKIERFGARSPIDQPELQLYIQRWKRSRFGEIEASLTAYLRDYYRKPGSDSRQKRHRPKNRLGFFRETDMAFPLPSSSLMQRKYNEVLKRALVKLASELNSHVATRIEFDAELYIEDSEDSR